MQSKHRDSCLSIATPKTWQAGHEYVSNIHLHFQWSPFDPFSPCILQGKLCKAATTASLVVSLALTVIMYKRFLSTGKFMPAGIVSLLSAAMTLFYVWNLLVIKPPSSARSA